MLPDLPDRLGPVTVVSGFEPLLVDRTLRRLLDLAGRSGQAEAQETSVEELRTGDLVALTAPSLFGPPPVVVIRDVERIRADPGPLRAVVDELVALVAAPPPDARLILVHGGGPSGKAVLKAARDADAAEVVVSAPSKPWEVRPHRERFVRAELDAQGRSITPDALLLLVDAVGHDLAELAAACQQLGADSSGTIDRDVVGRYYSGHADVKGFDVADRVLAGQTRESLALARQLLDAGTDPVPVVAAVASQVRRLARVSVAPRSASNADLATALGANPRAVGKWRDLARGWTAGGWAAAVHAVTEADDAVKGGEVNREYALERMLVRLGEARSRS